MQFLMNSARIEQPFPGGQHWSRTADPAERAKRQEGQGGPKADGKTVAQQKAEVTKSTNGTEASGSAQSGSPEKDFSHGRGCSDEPEKPTPIIYKA